MNSLRPWARILRVVGGITMLLGTLDPLEGCVVILAGSGLIALSMYLDGKGRRAKGYWTSVFALIAIGVAAMVALSAGGGIGGRSGRSLWWGVLLLPYPVGWLMALGGAVAGLAGWLKGRGQPAPGGQRNAP